MSRQQHSIFIMMLYYHLPKWLRPSLLTGSGYGPKEYPLLHNIIYTWNIPITFIMAMILMVHFVSTMRKDKENYQFARIGQTFLAAFWVNFGITAHIGSMNFGKGWQLFVDSIVSINDTCQYLVGMNFGRTPLIKLSPNKTAEGYFGGALLTMPFVYWLLGALFSSDYYKCPHTHLTLAPFEE